MGRLDLRDTYRDEDFECGDVRNPGTRQVRTAPARGGAKLPGDHRVQDFDPALSLSTPLRSRKGWPHYKQMSVDDCIAVAEIGSDAWIAQEIAAGRSGEERDA